MISIIGQELVVQEFIKKMLLGELRTMRSKEEFPQKVIDWETDVFVGGDVTRSRGYFRIRRRGAWEDSTLNQTRAKSKVVWKK